MKKENYLEFDPRNYKDSLFWFIADICKREEEKGNKVLVGDVELGRVENNVNLHYIKYFTVDLNFKGETFL